MTMKPHHLVRGSGESLEDFVARLAEAGPHAIDDRLAELETEWSIGRAAKVSAGALALGAAAAETTGRRRVATLLAVTAGSCLLPYVFGRQSVVGSFLGRFGFRQGTDIERERIALRALRGDFRHVPTMHEVESHEDIARLEGEGGIASLPDERKLDPHEAAAEVLRRLSESQPQGERR